MKNNKHKQFDIASKNIGYLIREILAKNQKYRIQKKGIELLHFAVEAYAVDSFTVARDLCKITNHKQLQSKHLQVVQKHLVVGCNVTTM